MENSCDGLAEKDSELQELDQELGNYQAEISTMKAAMRRQSVGQEPPRPAWIPESTLDESSQLTDHGMQKAIIGMACFKSY